MNPERPASRPPVALEDPRLAQAANRLADSVASRGWEIAADNTAQMICHGGGCEVIVSKSPEILGGVVCAAVTAPGTPGRLTVDRVVAVPDAPEHADGPSPGVLDDMVAALLPSPEELIGRPLRGVPARGLSRAVSPLWAESTRGREVMVLDGARVSGWASEVVFTMPGGARVAVSVSSRAAGVVVAVEDPSGGSAVVDIGGRAHLVGAPPGVAAAVARTIRELGAGE